MLRFPLDSRALLHYVAHAYAYARIGDYGLQHPVEEATPQQLAELMAAPARVADALLRTPNTQILFWDLIPPSFRQPAAVKDVWELLAILLHVFIAKAIFDIYYGNALGQSDEYPLSPEDEEEYMNAVEAARTAVGEWTEKTAREILPERVAATLVLFYGGAGPNWNTPEAAQYFRTIIRDGVQDEASWFMKEVARLAQKALDEG